MIRIIQAWGASPIQCPVDEKLEFHAGKIVTVGKILGISDGFHNDGVVDDINSTQDRVNCVEQVYDGKVGKYCLSIKRNESLIKDSVKAFAVSDSNKFESEYIGNEYFIKKDIFDLDIKVNKNSVELISSKKLEELYIYPKPLITIIIYSKNIKEKGLCSTVIATRSATVWNKPMIYQTDMYEFEKLPTYKKYQKLYVRNGLLTNEKWDIRLEPVGFLMDIDSKFNMTVFKS